jgi:hypothetical protein
MVLVFCAFALALVAIPVALAITVTGSITNSDPTQTGRLQRDGTGASCATPKANPGLNTPVGARHFDAYTYTNATGATQCVTVDLTTPCFPDDDIFDAAYTSFVPSDPTTNWLADPGVSSASTSFSFNAPAHSSFDVVVHEVTSGAGCPSYTLDVSGTGIFEGTLPTSKEQCMNDGWKNFPAFKNQGDCVSFVASGGKNPPGKP